MNQNLTAKPNLVWAADITTFTFDPWESKLHVFLCIDIHTNMIVTHRVSQKPLETKSVVKAISGALEQRIKPNQKVKLIIHSDRGTPFSSRAYFNFTERYKEFFKPSMTPTDNPVAERFIRTFKEHELENFTIEKLLTYHLNSGHGLKYARSIVNKYVKSLNKTPNQKTKPMSPQTQDKETLHASLLMIDPVFPQARSEHFGDDFRRSEVRNFKFQNAEVRSIVKEIAAKQVELVDTTPFDQFEDKIALAVIDERLNSIYDVIAKNPQITKEYIEEAIEPVEYSLEVLHEKINQLLPKEKKDRIIQPLRDPIDNTIFPLILANAGSHYKYQLDLKSAQLRVAYTILYHVGLRVNEIRQLKEKDISDAIAASQLRVINSKTKHSSTHVLSKKATEALKSLKNEYAIIFQKYKYNYLLGKDKPIHQVSLIRMINTDLKKTCKSANLPFNIKSHSFRINVISNLLRVTSVQNAANVIGHDDIRSTMNYKRYALSKKEIQELLEKIDG